MGKTAWFVIFCAGAAAAIGACSSTSTTGGTEASGDQGVGGATTSSASTTSSTTSSGTTSSTSGSTSSTSGSTSSGGGNLVNGCDPATAEDHTADTTTTITFPVGGLKYSPPCIKIAAGHDVKFSGDFASHPLRPGTVDPVTPDANSPIKNTDTGTSATFTFTTAGTFGYYCSFHQPGMAGAIFVQ
jgi:plastocyanin